MEYKKRGPKPRHTEPRREFHLKFSASVADYIERHSPQGYQAFFDELIQREMNQEDRKPKTPARES